MLLAVRIRSQQFDLRRSRKARFDKLIRGNRRGHLRLGEDYTCSTRVLDRELDFTAFTSNTTCALAHAGYECDGETQART